MRLGRLHMIRKGSLVAFALALATSSLTSSALAVREHEALGSAPVFERASGGDASVRGHAVWQRPGGRMGPAIARFESEFGSDWRMTFDSSTDVPSRLYGPGLPAPGSVADGAVALAFAKGILARHIDLLAPGNDLGTFELVSNDLDAGMRTLGFVQKVGGMRVRGGQLSFRFKNDRLFMLGSEALPSVPSLSAPTSPDLDGARKAAATWIEADFGASTAGGLEEMVVLPERTDTGLAYAVAIPVIVTPDHVTAKYRVFVDAKTLQPLAREQMLHFASASVLLRVPERSPTFGERFDAPARLATITVGGTSGTTDDAGAVTWDGADPTAVEMRLEGDRARVSNEAGPEAILSTSLADAVPHVFDASNDEQVDAQLTTFVHASHVREFARGFAPGLPFLDTQVRATVNINDICNAYSDGTTINFFLSGQGCENSGRIADVIYHEYGHSLHFHAIIEGVGSFDGALSEGQGDYLAATITGDPGTARGFIGPGPLRDLDPLQKSRWPLDLNGEVHNDGLIIGQTLWNLRTALVAQYGQAEGVQVANRLYYQALRRAVDMPSMHPEMLAADDDDGDITNGTPNVCAINAAFDAHGLRTIGASSANLDVLPAEVDGYTVTVRVTGLFPECPGDALLGGSLTWRDRDDPSNSGELDLDVTGEEMTATIPSQPEHTVIHYRVDVELDGRELHLPDNEADKDYQLFVGSVTELYCTDFETNPFENGWFHGLTSGQNEEGADDWMWGRPSGTTVNGDPPLAFSGERAIGNDLALANNFNGLYQADKVNYAASPVIELEGHRKVAVMYRRWLNVEDAAFDRATIYANEQPVWQNLDSNNGDQSNTQHLDREWRFHVVDVSNAVVDDKMQIKFEIASDPGLEYGGWTIDDFCIVALDAPVPPCEDGGPCNEGGGGEGGQGGGGEDGNNLDPDADEGCDCNVGAGSDSGPNGLGAFALGAIGLAALRRRRR